MAAPVPEEHRRGRYLLGQRLGVGDVAEVFLAHLEGEGGFRRRIVLKCLRSELSHEPERVQLFLDEANLVAHLRHPNIVQALDLSRDGSDYFMALELVDGPSLANLIGYTRGVGTRIPIEIGAHVVAEAARGLHYAHEAQGADGEALEVVHRDIRPGTILISLLGEVKGQNPHEALASTIGLEKEINTFFRLQSPSVIARLREAFDDLPESPDAKTVFLKLRELRNSW